MKTDEQINEELAKVMGLSPRMGWLWDDADPSRYAVCLRDEFAPATSHDAFHAHVVPVLEERGLQNHFIDALDRAIGTDLESGTYESLWIEFKVSPRTLCEAALAVLGGQSDE